MAQVEARAGGADEAILLNNQGGVACGSRSNIFAVIKGKVITPPIEEGALPGITRAMVLHLCRELSIQTAEARLGHGDLAKAEEVFLTNSLLEIVPVRRADGRLVPTGAVTQRLAAAYSQLLPC
jgi:branched-chain amino acid aminotransferase